MVELTVRLLELSIINHSVILLFLLNCSISSTIFGLLYSIMSLYISELKYTGVNENAIHT